MHIRYNIKNKFFIFSYFVKENMYYIIIITFIAY